MKNSQPWRKFENWCKSHNQRQVAGDKTACGNVIACYLSAKGAEAKITQSTSPSWILPLLKRIEAHKTPTYQFRTVLKWMVEVKQEIKNAG